MSINGWPGGVIRKTPITPDGAYYDSAASGVWSLADAASYMRQGLWPIVSNLRATAYWAGGLLGPAATVRTNVIQYVSIASLGNTSDWGDLTAAREQTAGCASSTRGIIAGGFPEPSGFKLSSIEYITISTSGSSSSFGNLHSGTAYLAGLSNSTRGVFGGGMTEIDSGTTNVMNYITIASAGNSADFGDLSSKRYSPMACASTTRGLFGGGATVIGGDQYGVSAIQYITIATTGNALTFGDLSLYRNSGSGLSSSTRGVFLGGDSGNSVDEVSDMVAGSRIDYVTIASTGNATFFGSLTTTQNKSAASCSETRGLTSMKGADPVNVINYITIASTGNALDFGDLINSPISPAGFSNGHGGL